MESDSAYWHDTQAAFDSLELIDTDALQKQWRDGWSSQTLCKVNDCVVRLGVGHGKFHWHKHANEDEFFFVIDGTLRIHLDERSVELGSGQAFTVPRQVIHRTEAVGRTVILMVEGETVVPTGDV